MREREREKALPISRNGWERCGYSKRESVFFFLLSQEGGVTALRETVLSVSVEPNERGLFYCIAESLSWQRKREKIAQPELTQIFPSDTQNISLHGITSSWLIDQEETVGSVTQKGGKIGPASSCPPMSWTLQNWTPAFAPLKSTCIWSWSRQDWVQATSASHHPKSPPAAPHVSFASSWSTRVAATDAGSPSRTPGKIQLREEEGTVVRCFAVLTWMTDFDFFMNYTELVRNGWMVIGQRGVMSLQVCEN